MTPIDLWQMPLPEDKIIYRIKDDCYLLYNEDAVLILLRSLPSYTWYQSESEKGYTIVNAQSVGLKPDVGAVVVRNPAKNHLVLCDFREYMTVQVTGPLQLNPHTVVSSNPTTTLSEENWDFLQQVTSGNEADELGAKRDERKFERLMKLVKAW